MNKLKIIIVIFVGLALSIGVSSCEKALKPYEGVKTVVNYDLMETTLNFQFIDAATGGIIGINEQDYINLTYFGENKDLLLDMTGELYDTYKSDQGFVINAVHPDFEMSDNHPFIITAVASAPGYINNTEQIYVFEKGETIVIFKMVKIDSPPSGVTIEKQANAATVTGGTVAETSVIKTTGNELTVTIPQGMTLKTKEGVELSGSLSVMVAHFDNMDDNALEAFPGGLFGTATINGAKEDIIFESAGFMAIEIIDANGNKAAELENSNLEVSVKLNPATNNPETGELIKVGDLIPLFSLNEETGEWLFEKNAVVILKGGELYIDTEVEHLSYWNLDWWYSANCGYSNNNAKIKFTGDPAVVGNWINVRFTMRRQSNGSYMKSYWKYAYVNQEMNIVNGPKGIPVYFEFETSSSCGSTAYSFNPNPLYIDDLCESQTYNVAVNPQPNSNIQDVTINIEGFCPNNKNIVVYPTYSGYIRPVDSYCWQYIHMNAGVATARLDVTKEYIAGTYTYNGWYQTTFKADTLQSTYVGLEMPAEICNSY